MILNEVSMMKPGALKQGIPESEIKTAAERVRNELEPFRRTITLQVGGMQTYDNYADSAEKVATALMQKGMKPRDAAVRAVNSLVGYKYEFEDTYRVPKSELGGTTTLSAIHDGAMAARFDIAGPERERPPAKSATDGLSPTDVVSAAGAGPLAPVAVTAMVAGNVVRNKVTESLYEQRMKDWRERPKEQQQALMVPAYPAGMRPEDAEEQWRDTVRLNGFWVTSPGDGGLTLYVKSGLSAQPVLDDRGQPIRRSWEELVRIGTEYRTAFMSDVYRPGVRMP